MTCKVPPVTATSGAKKIHMPAYLDPPLFFKAFIFFKSGHISYSVCPELCDMYMILILRKK